MSDYIFENKNELYLRDCKPEEIGAVYKAYWDNSEYLEIQHGDEVWYQIGGDVYEDAVYRVLAKPYTLEDALKEIDSKAFHIDCGEYSGYVVKLDNADSIIRKLAKSLGGES